MSKEGLLCRLHKKTNFAFYEKYFFEKSRNLAFNTSKFLTRYTLVFSSSLMTSKLRQKINFVRTCPFQQKHDPHFFGRLFFNLTRKIVFFIGDSHPLLWIQPLNVAVLGEKNSSKALPLELSFIFFLRPGKLPLQATKNATTLARKISQSWSFIPFVLIISELLLKIANSE